MISAGSYSIKTWKQVCGWIGWKPFRFRACVHVPVTRFKAPTFQMQGGVPGVSVAEIGPYFDGYLFYDGAHLNPVGFEYHADYLKNSLRDRCWWLQR